jgi:hypothetical protein
VNSVSQSVFSDFLHFAGWSFAFGVAFVQMGAFYLLERPRLNGDPNPLRRSILSAILRGGVAGMVSALIVFGLWVPQVWSQMHWEVLVALEILFGLVLIEMGLAGVAIRASLMSVTHLPEKQARLALVMIRAGMLTIGWIYAWAFATHMPHGPGETLLAVSLLGAALLALGLNRAGDVPVKSFDRLIDE